MSTGALANAAVLVVLALFGLPVVLIVAALLSAVLPFPVALLLCGSAFLIIAARILRALRIGA